MARVHIIYFDISTGYYPSLHHGLAYILGMLKQGGHNTSLSHLTTEDELALACHDLSEQHFHVLGVSFTTNQKRYVPHTVKMLRKSADFIIAGGIHSSLVQEKLLEEMDELDGVCCGEGEHALRDLCDCIDSKGSTRFLDSFIMRTKEGIQKNPIRNLCDLDTLPLPDYSEFKLEKIVRDSGDCFPMMLSRGCPYSCSYCCNHRIKKLYPDEKRYVRYPSVKRAIEIIRNNIALYPKTKKIVFADDTFTLNKKWLKELCGRYKEEIGLPFMCNARVETINRDIAEYLHQAGCISVDFGVESGNDWLRINILNRRHSNVTIKNAFKIVQSKGLKCFSFNIVGLPFETNKMMYDTLKLNMEIQPYFGKVFYFYPYPKTKIESLCREYDLIRDDFSSVSGYLEKSSVKEIFASYDEIKACLQKIQLYFYAQLILSKVKLPLFMKSSIYCILFRFRWILWPIVDSNSAGFIKKLRSLFRKIALLYLR